MSAVVRGRFTAKTSGEVVVFLIGARINTLWKVWQWWPTLAAMSPMLRELYTHPEIGFLGAEYHLSLANRAPMIVQYWRSFDDLERFARSSDHTHLPAWRRFITQAAASAGVGIWHETYVVPAGRAEAVYANMPAFGLAKVTEHVPATGERETARGRLATRD